MLFSVHTRKQLLLDLTSSFSWADCWSRRAFSSDILVLSFISLRVSLSVISLISSFATCCSRDASASIRSWATDSIFSISASVDCWCSLNVHVKRNNKLKKAWSSSTLSPKCDVAYVQISLEDCSRPGCFLEYSNTHTRLELNMKNAAWNMLNYTGV